MPERDEEGLMEGTLFDPQIKAGPGDVQPFGLTAEEAAALYRWAVGDGRRKPPEDPDEMRTVGRALVLLSQLAGAALGWEPVELADIDEQQLGPFVRASETSRRAAVEAYPRQGSQRHRIIARLFARQTGGRPGATRDELAAELGLSPNTVRPRVVELIAGGWLEPAAESSTNTDETRRTALGREAEVLVLTHAAMARCVRDGATSADRR